MQGDLKDRAILLHTLTDRLNEAIDAINKRFQDLGLGVAATLKMDEEHALSFSKVGGAFQLLIETPDERIALLASSRSMRIRAIPMLELLYEQMQRNLDLEINQIARATAMAHALDERIEKES